MECLSSGSSTSPVLISNAKVLEMLQKSVKENKKRLAKVQKAKDKKHNKKTVIRNRFEHRDWIEEKVMHYLKKTPCVHLPIQKIPELKRKCMGSKQARQPSQKKSSDETATADHADETASSNDASYGLTEAETLQILNFMPEEPVEIHLMVEELHARMSETQQEEFLAMIKSYSTKGKKASHAKKRKRSDSDAGNQPAVDAMVKANKDGEETAEGADAKEDDDFMDVLLNDENV